MNSMQEVGRLKIYVCNSNIFRAIKECCDMNKKDNRVMLIAVVYKVPNQDSRVDRNSMAVSAMGAWVVCGMEGMPGYPKI
jgi:hypothetical protein